MSESNATAVSMVNRRARDLALQAMRETGVEATSLVNYQSRGRVAVIGDQTALEIAPRLNDKLSPIVVLTRGAEEPGAPVVPVGGRDLRIEGYLGAFKIHLGEAGRANAEILAVDLILDLSHVPLMDREMNPPGYYHSSIEEDQLSPVLDEMAQMTGNFEKPRYFDYDPAICAHGRSGKHACTRCIDACPADAITSLAETVEVNSYLCQGGGACASVCPSGAMRYLYPSVRDTLQRLRQLLHTYREQGGGFPVVVLHAASDQPLPNEMPAHYLPVMVEELASIGMDVWLTVLAYGARQVLLADDGGMPSAVKRAMQEQFAVAEEILRAMGYPQTSIRLIAHAELLRDSSEGMPEIPLAGFSGIGSKRQSIYLAIDHLYDQAERPKPMASLPAGAPFGTVYVEEKACTLCLSCVGACPGKALQSGSEGMPQLRFIEANCLQCGLCTRTCPEDAIWITPRLLFDAERRNQTRTLREEEPFRCTACGKPFATRSVIEKMRSRLKDHYMFQSERALKRLTLCDSCRVVDIVQDAEAMGGDLDGRLRQ
ncbi:MAG: 4Fe-4S binding protein [Candidatus Thiodiazotropha endolucinida]|nr:4Fe-4S binding protein [Candidatus Thiodiazotropha taylori]MCG8096233.1 4Fe-4S binding protein [Candidatus Thiodiazotropha endolucinida]MCG8061827.1 4Fe-4S binding protein [Candidatus Thiodiazotropha taylori]MCG8066145.1 4Fe-4S binding protein [Candidatus Thiodiazotropha taylori]MCW4332242.1 4Fe-4S binding protein [Candidatus Thiodiazotropha endolucinida]